MLKRTPLFSVHQELGARLVEFGGWEMPVQYTSIVDEHLGVRSSGGLFDISHMGEVFFSGKSAFAFLNSVLTNDLGKLASGHGQYTLLCQSDGGVVDDLYAYRLADDQFLLIVNASRREEDVAWLKAQLAEFADRGDVVMDDASDRYGAVAVQGPKVRAWIDSCFQALTGASAEMPSAMTKNQIGVFALHSNPAAGVYVGCTGYTGEDGYEVIAPADRIAGVWAALMAAGQASGLKPAGLGARDTLRTEMGYPLYGHELDLKTTPLEAGLGFFVALNKGPFVGRDALQKQKSEGLSKKCVAFKLLDKGAPPRPGYAIYENAQSSSPLGQVVSGTQSPSLGLGIGMGFVAPACATLGGTIFIEARGKRYQAVIVKKPIYQKPAQAD